jgi:hypothetical protein
MPWPDPRAKTRPTRAKILGSASGGIGKWDIRISSSIPPFWEVYPNLISDVKEIGRHAASRHGRGAPIGDILLGGRGEED